MIAPQSPAELADLLRGGQDPLRIVGGGTSLPISRPDAPPLVDLSLAAIAGVREYRPEDMTVSFLAGTPLTTVRQTLAEHRQELTADFPLPDRGTIGGLVATGFTGPLRLAAGPLKDQILGAEFVRADGVLAHAGGMVVKNVSGLDLPRMFWGSWGGLAVITAVNLKVAPLAEADTTLRLPAADLPAALTAVGRALAADADLNAAVVDYRAGAWTLALRLRGRAPTVEARRAAVTAAVGGDPDRLNSAAWWQAWLDAWATPARQTIITANGPRPALEAAARQLTPVVDRLSLQPLPPALRLAVDDPAAAIPILAAAGLRWRADVVPGGWPLPQSPWGPPRPDQPLADRLKHQFDPHRLLNRDLLAYGNR